MAESTIWWIVAGVAIIAELMTSTFYLLMLCVGLVSAAIAAHLGASVVTQIVVAAVLGVGAMVAWHLIRGRFPKELPAGENRDVNLDIGGTVNITSWHANGTATVKYRGAQWTAVPVKGAAASTGLHRIAAVDGNRLVVESA